MNKKYLALLFLPLMSGCTLLGGPDDFSGMYEAHTTAQIASLRELAHDIGIGQKYALDGSMKFAAAVPGVMSGVLSTDYSSSVDGKNMSFTAKNLLLAYEALIASGSVSMDTFGITSHAGDAYFLLAGLRETNMLSPTMMDVLKKYDNVWLSLTQEDIQKNLAGASTEDILSYQISESLSSLTLEEIEGYLQEYPVFQETKDLGMSGSLHSYEIMLNTPNIISLVDELSERITGSGLTSDERESLSKDLSTLQSKGTITYDPKNASYAHLMLTLTPPGSESVNIEFHESEQKYALALTTGVNVISFSTEKTENDVRNTVIGMSQGELEIGKLIATAKYDSDTLAELQMTLSSPAQGITVTLLHKNMKDGTFEGNMNFGIGNTSWNGKIVNKALSSLTFRGAMPGQSLTLDLTTTEGDMMRGPLVMKSGDEEVFRADVGLRLTPERFSMALDMPLPVQSTGSLEVPKVHFDGDIIAKRSDLNNPVKAPSDSVPLENLIDALDALANAPKEDFFETTYDGDMTTDNSGSFVMPTGEVIDSTESVQN